MIKVENIEVWGFEHAIRGMRNPLNSWNRSDSYPAVDCGKCGRIEREGICHPKEHDCTPYYCYEIGENDLTLMRKLFAAGHPHRKYLRQIFVAYGGRIYCPIWEMPENNRIKLRPVYPRIPNGSRNICLTSLAGMLHNQGYSKQQIYDELLYCNTVACDPPLDRGEIQTICNSVTRYKR